MTKGTHMKRIKKNKIQRHFTTESLQTDALVSPTIYPPPTGFFPTDSPPASHFAVRVTCKKDFQLQSTFHKVTERVSKSSINDLISIVIGSLPFRLQEIYEAISRKE